MGSRRHFFCINVNLRVGNTYRILIYHDISWCILGILVLQCAWIILIYHGVSWCILGDDFPRNLQWVRAPLRGLPFRECDLHRHGMSWYCFSNVFHIADSFGSAGYTWLVVWLPFFIFPYIEFLIIPIDFHIFQMGGPTTNQLMHTDLLLTSESMLAICWQPLWLLSTWNGPQIKHQKRQYGNMGGFPWW